MLYVRRHETKNNRTILTDTTTGLSQRVSDDLAIQMAQKEPIYGISYGKKNTQYKHSGYTWKIISKHKQVLEKYNTVPEFRKMCGDISVLAFKQSPIKQMQAKIRAEKKAV